MQELLTRTNSKSSSFRRKRRNAIADITPLIEFNKTFNANSIKSSRGRCVKSTCRHKRNRVAKLLNADLDINQEDSDGDGVLVTPMPKSLLGPEKVPNSAPTECAKQVRNSSTTNCFVPIRKFEFFFPVPDTDNPVTAETFSELDLDSLQSDFDSMGFDVSVDFLLGSNRCHNNSPVWLCWLRSPYKFNNHQTWRCKWCIMCKLWVSTIDSSLIYGFRVPTTVWEIVGQVILVRLPNTMCWANLMLEDDYLHII